MNINDIKKVELHVHLDGSVRVDTFSEIKGISKNDAYDLLVAPDDCKDLNEYLSRFSSPGSVMQDEAGLERIAYELARDLKNENCIYAEIRFAPNKHTSILNLDKVIESVLRGLRRVDMKSNLILCMMRGDSFEDNKRVIDLASKYLNKGVCAIDLAGAEKLFKTSEYESLFEYASSLNIPFTIHAGEADDVSSVNDAISFGASRLGHGVRSLESDETIELIKNKNILLEVCPTSNIQTKVVRDYLDHPIKKLFDLGVRVCINTDNRTVSNTSLNKEYEILYKTFDFSEEDFIKMNEYAISSSFISEDEKIVLKSMLK